MVVYITKTFDTLLEKGFSNYFINREKLSKELKRSFNDTTYLKRPIMKFKVKINSVSYRIVGIVKGDTILPILIYLKKDKKIGDNIIWNKELEILVNHYAQKMEYDIKTQAYSIY